MTHRELWKAGCSVLPCRADKSPNVSSWKEFQQRRASEEEVTGWERSKPALWAVVTGVVSALFVLDFDTPHGEETMHGLGLNPHVRTPSGGFHVYITYPPGEHIGNKTQLMPDMDVRADGGYACCEGGKYEWLRPFEPDTWDSLPKDLREMLTGKSKPQASITQNTQSDVPERDSDAVTGKRVESDVLLHRALEQSPSGRNDAAFWLACQMRDNGYTETETRPVLQDFARYCGPTDAHGRHEPLTDAEIEATLKSAFKNPPREPWSTAGQNQNPGTAGAEGAHKPEVYSDYYNARLFHEQHGADVRYCVNDQTWYIWNDAIWEPDTMGAIKRIAMDTVQSLYAKLIGMGDKESILLLRHIKSSESDNRIFGLLELVKPLVGISVKPDIFDADPFLLAVQNGTLNLQTGQLLASRREDYITVQLPVRHNPYAVCPRWRRFIEEIFPEDEDTQAYVKRMCGYAITGDTSRQELYTLYGKPSCGKSVFAETLRTILGGHAAAILKSQLAIDPRGGANDRTAVASIWSKRLATCSEFEETDRLDEGLVKSLTGGDTISVRHLYGRPFSVQPRFRLMLYTNHIPKFRSVGYDMRRRMRMVPFLQTFYSKEDKKDPIRNDKLKDELLQEADGIFGWMLEGCLDYQKNGMPMSEAIRECTAAVFEEMDVIGDFLRERCTFDLRESVLLKELWKALETWCCVNRRKSPFADSRGLRANLQNRDGIFCRKGMHGVLAEGLTLKTIATDDDDDGDDAFPIKSLMRAIP